MTSIRILTRVAQLTRPANNPRRRRQFLPDSLERFEGRIVPATTSGSVLVQSFQTVGDREFVTVTNNTSQSVKVTLADYAFTQSLFNFFDQHYVGSSSATIKAGDTRTIAVDLECNAFNQIDVLANEDPITQFQGVPNYLFDPHLVGAQLTGLIICENMGNEKPHGNEGLGNGVDPPPPGHAGDTQQNDDPGHGPGNPNHGWNS
jgi:hypothetical protein